MTKKKLLTVDKILGVDDLTDVLKDVYDHRHQIDQFILIYTDKDSVPHQFWSGTNERIVYALEQAKLKILRPERNND